MLRGSLCPGKPKPGLLEDLAVVIRHIEEALEAGRPVDLLMKDRNRLAQRTDIEASRYDQLHASMTCKEAAYEALMPRAIPVADITRAELEEIARRILDPENHSETQYYLDLFERNTPSGNSDLFYWPDEGWLKQLNVDAPSAAQIVDKALEAKPI